MIRSWNLQIYGFAALFLSTPTFQWQHWNRSPRCEMAYLTTYVKVRVNFLGCLGNWPNKAFVREGGGTMDRFREARSQRPFVTNMETVLNHFPHQAYNTSGVTTDTRMGNGLTIIPQRPHSQWHYMTWRDGWRGQRGIRAIRHLCNWISELPTGKSNRGVAGPKENLDRLGNAAKKAFRTMKSGQIPILLDAHALNHKEGEHVVHKSHSWADVEKGNCCSPWDP